MTEKKTVKDWRGERDELGFWKMEGATSPFNKLFRLPFPVDPTFKIDNLPWLTDEEKAKGNKHLQAFLNPTYGAGIGTGELPGLEVTQPFQADFCMMNDPEVWSTYFEYYERAACLLMGINDMWELAYLTTFKKGIDVSPERADDPEVRRKMHNAILTLGPFAVENKDQYTLRLLAWVPFMFQEKYEDKQYRLSAEQIAMLPYPESSIWNLQESLVLELTYAYIRHTMTDELWNRCVEVWGVKETGRYLQWMGAYAHMFNYNYVMFRRDVW
ncbi:MAG: hypothetical protein HKP58_15175 [Desulfatitalea sp.]|nr:hypothetical protein [Desulfatitalea sp.]NNK01751.1 hypothetical protein [Desulfatitalea sp.]